MRFLSVCSGIEAASVAWEGLGWKALAFSEIEAFPRAVLQHHYPDTPLHGDFTRLRDEEWIVDADLLVGGTPCQAFSVAGLRKSLDDERGNLSLEFIRLADAIDDLRCAAGKEPARVLWENVPGVLSTHDNAFGAFLGGLVGGDSAIEPPHGQGWRSAGVVAGPRRVAAWRILDAQYFGVAQRRRRVFVLALGGARGWTCADALLPIINSLSGHPAPRREAGERTAAGTLRSTDGGCDVDHARAGHLVGYRETGQGWWTEGLMGLRATPGGVPSNIEAHTLRGEGFDASEDGTGRGTPLVPVTIGALCRDSFSGGAGGRPEGAAAGHFIPVAFRSKASAGQSMNPGLVAPTLDVGKGGGMAVEIQERALSDSDRSGPGGKGWQENVAYTMEARHRPQHVGYGIAVRRILPVEAERLQGFPDDWTLVPYRGKPAKDGPRYKALGNSMAVPVVRWLGERIQMVEDLCKITSAEDAA